MVIQYMQGAAEIFKNICSKYQVQTYFKSISTPKNILPLSKDHSMWITKVELSIGIGASSWIVMIST